MSFERCRNLLLAAIAGTASISTEADPPTFQITSLYSNLDGSAQVVVLTESAGLHYQYHFAGFTLTATHDGITKVYTLPSNLPLISTRGASIVLATDQLSLEAAGWFGGGRSHCRLPERFLPTDGGTVEFAGVDRVTYESLPSDGLNGLLRDGTVARVALPPFVCGPGFVEDHCRAHPLAVYVAESRVTAIEYYNAIFDHYFMSASASDIEALDTGRRAGWQRTGLTFEVGSRPLYTLGWDPYGYLIPTPYPLQPVCRFYIPPELGDSHFYSAFASECAEVRARFPTFVQESEAAFYAALPDLITGKCAPSQVPVYSMWNRRTDSNHRYTVDLSVRGAMVAKGYVSEGYGPAAVAFCVPDSF